MSIPAPVVDVHVETYYRVGLPSPILHDIHLRIEAGQHWALIGENGSGKSSLLAVIAGDLWPSRGTIRVLGHEYGRVDKRELKKRIGVVSAALYTRIPAHDLAQEVVGSGLSGAVARMGALPEVALETARRALGRVGALAIATKTYGVLSQGEKQRVMIARALVNQPDLLILDEPCSGLDPVARERFLSDLRTLAREPDGPTQLIVTHHLEEIPGFVTHALLLKQGQMMACGPVARVLTSERLSLAFGTGCEVHVEAGPGGPRYRLRIATAEGAA